MWLKHYKLNDDEQKLVDMSSSEFDKYMMKSYPDQFVNRNQGKDQEIVVPMNFGFEIGPGWRHVLDSLCSKLHVMQTAYGATCIFDQIKEKYGSARFYYHIEFGSFNIEEEKEVRGIIEDLVNYYEEYTDYICEELGTNVQPDEKIRLGSWAYGTGIEGFKKQIKALHPDCCNKNNEKSESESSTFECWKERIYMANDYLARTKKKKDINSALYSFSMDQLENIEKVINKTRDENKGVIE